jgi:hypothetical protein
MLLADGELSNSLQCKCLCLLLFIVYYVLLYRFMYSPHTCQELPRTCCSSSFSTSSLVYQEAGRVTA